MERMDMSIFLQRHAGIILIGATAVCVLSLWPWLIWTGILLLGAGYGSFLLTALAVITAVLWPVVSFGSLLMGVFYQRRSQSKKALLSLLVPTVYFPLMLIIGFIALWEGT